MAVPEWLASDEAVCHIEHTPGSAGVPVDWPEWFPPNCLEAVRGRGIERPWSHQAEAADIAFAGRHVAICTATASGKTLAYLMPVLAATAGGVVGGGAAARRPRLVSRPHTALYLAPTKALAHDQLRAARELGPPGWQVGTLDGDSDQAERRYAREHARYVLSNPDMVHRSLLPNHTRWSGFLGSLRYVVIDESHRYRGVFGAHVAAVVRRLRRICALYGADPVFLLASATATNAGEAGARLIGEDAIEVVSRDGSPRAARDVVLWRPADSVHTDAASLLGRLVDAGSQTIAFVPSRLQAELISMRAQEAVREPERIASYRSGYLAGDRRTIEKRLQDGSLTGVAATNALELGVDIAGMDAVLIAGFPGTLAALWQQAGRAGRGTRDALVVLLQREDPLDSFLFAHPERIFGAPVEGTVLHPGNPHVLGPHLAAASQEAALTASDQRWFGPGMTALADQLAAQGMLRRRPAGWFWVRPERAVDSIDLRSLGGRPVDIVDQATGRVVGTVDRAAADRSVHDGAVYLHLGEQWVVDCYDPDDNCALVRAERPRYYTQPQQVSGVRILSEDLTRPAGHGAVSFGRVELSSQVVGYLRRDERTGEVWDSTPLELPVHTLRTQAMWWTLPADAVAELGLNQVELAGAAHGAEHTAIGLLPAFAPCDRWDIGGVSTVVHPDTDQLTIVVHDAHPGGAGFAERGYEVAEQWARAVLERLESCPCETGCPACVVSPKCGNANQSLDKTAARALMAVLVERVPSVAASEPDALGLVPERGDPELAPRTRRRTVA